MLDRLPFARIVCCDTEYVARPGERVLPVCLVAKELRSGQVSRRSDGRSLANARPIRSTSEPCSSRSRRRPNCRCTGRSAGPTRSSARPVRRAPAERQWPPLLTRSVGPARRDGRARARPGRPRSRTPCATGSWPARRSRHNERAEILAYCERDVDGLAQLLERMLPRILRPPEWTGARPQSRRSYGIAVAAMEATGIPIDTPLLHRLREHWDPIKDQLAIDVDREYGVFDGHEIDRKRFAEFIRPARHSLAAHAENRRPVHRQGHVQGHGAGQAHRLLNPLREALSTLGQMRLNDLQVGADGRNRCSLKPFWAITGRNQPSSASTYSATPPGIAD